MIELNFLPERSKSKVTGKNIKPQYSLYLIPIAFGVLILVHLSLAVLGIFSTCRFKALNNTWNKLAPQRQALKNLTEEYALSAENTNAIQQLNMRKLNWSKKLNRLSLDLPYGIWFNQLSFSRTDFTLNCSVLSLDREEMALVNKFIDNLKKDLGFFYGFNNLDLGSVQIKTIGGYDVFDFVLTGKIKSR